MAAAEQRPDRFDADVGGEYEVARGDKLLCPPLGALQVRAAGAESPEDDEAGKRLDQRVEAEANQGDRAGRDPGAEGNRELDEVPGVAAPGEQLRPSYELCPFGRRERSGQLCQIELSVSAVGMGSTSPPWRVMPPPCALLPRCGSPASRPPSRRGIE